MKFCECNYFTTACLSRLLNKMAEDAFKELKFAPSYGYILACVHAEPDIDCKTLCEHMMLTPSSLTRMTDKLEQMGYMGKCTSSRYTLHYLTPAGEALMPQIRQIWQKLEEEYIRIFGQKLSADLSTVVIKAIETYKESENK